MLPSPDEQSLTLVVHPPSSSRYPSEPRIRRIMRGVTLLLSLVHSCKLTYRNSSLLLLLISLLISAQISPFSYIYPCWLLNFHSPTSPLSHGYCRCTLYQCSVYSASVVHFNLLKFVSFPLPSLDSIFSPCTLLSPALRHSSLSRVELPMFSYPIPSIFAVRTSR